MYVKRPDSEFRYSSPVEMEFTGVLQMLRNKSCRIHTFLMGNVVLSLLVFGVVVYFIVVGEYRNLQDRNATEAVLNAISIGSLLYAGVFLIVALIAKPFLCSVRQE